MYDTSPEPSPRRVELQDLVDATHPTNPSTADPLLVHSLHHEKTSILSIAADARHIYSGSQGQDIYVWDRRLLKITKTLSGHTGSVLVLETCESKHWLFSASSDSTVRIWSTRTLSPLYVIIPNLDTESGDIYSLTYSPTLSTLYFGCQNTSLQWLDLSFAVNGKGSPKSSKKRSSSQHFEGQSTPGTPGKRFDKFFDSVPQSQRHLVPTPTSAHHPHTHVHQQHHTLTRVHSRQSETAPNAPSSLLNPTAPEELHVPPENVIESAHYGYVYCMALSPPHLYSGERKRDSPGQSDSDSDEEVYLITGSGDEDVKIWLATKNGLVEKHSFVGCEGGVLSIVTRHGLIYAGCQDGYIKVWDQESKTLVRTLLVDSPPVTSPQPENQTLSASHVSAPLSQHTIQNQISHRDANKDVLSLSMIGTDLYACLGNGWVERWSVRNFQATGFWKGHDGIILSSVATCPSLPPAIASVGVVGSHLGLEGTGSVEPTQTEVAIADETSGKAMFLTGGADSDIKLWSVEVPPETKPVREQDPKSSKVEDDLQAALAEFVAIPSVVNVESCREDCRQAALWLKRLLSQLGAEASLLSTPQGINPPVLATFRGSEEHKNRPRLHYDVIPAKKQGWESNPFVLRGQNGYLYGRGVSDNKGPILAAAFAISELRRKVSLGLDVVMLIEGEEEAGSRGFEQVIAQHKDEIGHIDGILIRFTDPHLDGEYERLILHVYSNSYWIGEDIPCITYGLRGVVHVKVEISNSGPDLHSGVEGGGLVEPMFDMVHLLNSISSGGKVTIPHFYDNVRPQSEEEQELYRLLEEKTGQDAKYLTSKWREPSLSIHSIETSGPGNRTVIPSNVSTQLSIRIVPDQDLSQIAASLEQHLRDSFDKLTSPNQLKITVDKAADWWLGDLQSEWSCALESAIEEEWGTRPLRIREGGSIPSIPFLEKTFSCPALHLPLGQSTDQAHLANERISINNLLKGKSVLERFFLNISAGKKCT
ncbi:Zn-dependent exopeptidase [Serendipita vermifera]|nr:Zn-dependent exopeptidase [Serendipita vermifera]